MEFLFLIFFNQIQIMAEFICISCNKKIFKSSYITKFQNNKKEYFITPKQKIKCDCGGEVELIEDNNKEEININVGRFSSLSYNERQESLKKRSKDDAKKQKYVENYKEAEFYNG